MDNRYGDPSYAELIDSLKTRLADLRDELGEIDNQFPEIQNVIDTYWED